MRVLFRYYVGEVWSEDFLTLAEAKESAETYYFRGEKVVFERFFETDWGWNIEEVE